MFPTGTSLRVNLPQSHCYLVANSMVGVIEFSTVLPVPVFYRYRTYSIGLYLYQYSTSTAVSFPVPVPVFYRYRICTQACFPICSHLWKGIPVALAGASISPRYTVILTPPEFMAQPCNSWMEVQVPNRPDIAVRLPSCSYAFSSFSCIALFVLSLLSGRSTGPKSIFVWAQAWSSLNSFMQYLAFRRQLADAC